MNAAFIPVSEDASEASKDSESSAPISEISHADGDGELTETWIEQASSVNLLRSDMTPSEKITDVEEKGLVNCLGASEFVSPKFASVEAEIVENFLRKAQSEVFNSLSASPHYRKLINEIINYVLEELHTVPEEKDRVAEVVSAKNRIMFLFLLLWIIGVSAVIFLTSDSHCSFGGPLPT
ncbi:protein SINE3 [Neltuma alba]|uniref:protein SINE3 n=1 Tax=Neltuma alba TaxID=207710 RepID=UPI0010A2FB46|nr:protein SINE3 [Prosopis alba]